MTEPNPDENFWDASREELNAIPPKAEHKELFPNETIAALLDATYVFGVDVGGPKHAIPRARLQAALRQHGPLQPDKWPHLVVAAMCGATTVIATAWGPWSRTSPHGEAGVCPHCAWYVAIDTVSVTEELAALRPRTRRESLAAAGVDPDVLATVCEAIITTASAPGAEYGSYHQRTLDLLAHVTRHGPVCLFSEDCAEGDCEREHDGGPCPGAVSCEACSLQVGSWAGEWEGQYDSVCTVPGPCEVFRTVAQHFGVTVARPDRIEVADD